MNHSMCRLATLQDTRILSLTCNQVQHTGKAYFNISTGVASSCPITEEKLPTSDWANLKKWKFMTIDQPALVFLFFNIDAH